MDEKTRFGNELAQRLADYGGDVLVVSGEIPENREGRHLKDQLSRSGTAAGAHYAEARAAQSRADFLHKITLAAKEARESLHWLHSGTRSELITRDVTSLIREGNELVAILTASQNTTRRNLDDP